MNSEAEFGNRIAALTFNQESVDSLAIWCTSHCSEAFSLVTIWSDSFRAAFPHVERQLNFLYLLHEIFKRSVGLGRAEYLLAFFRFIPKAVQHLIKHGNADTCKFVKAIVAFWAHNRFFDEFQLKTIEDALEVSFVETTMFFSRKSATLCPHSVSV